MSDQSIRAFGKVKCRFLNATLSLSHLDRSGPLGPRFFEPSPPEPAPESVPNDRRQVDLHAADTSRGCHDTHEDCLLGYCGTNCLRRALMDPVRSTKFTGCFSASLQRLAVPDTKSKGWKDFWIPVSGQSTLRHNDEDAKGANLNTQTIRGAATGGRITFLTIIPQKNPLQSADRRDLTRQDRIGPVGLDLGVRADET